MAALSLNSRWIYVGPGDFKGLRHTVISVDTQGIVTWSDPLPKEIDNSIAGFSWMGTREEFANCFRPTSG